MGKTLITDAAVEPITLAEAKLYLRVDISDDDTLITSLIKAARQEFERLTSRVLVNQTWDFTFDRFPKGSNPIVIPVNPVQSITSVTYLDANGASQTWATTEWQLVKDCNDGLGKIYLKYDKTYPDTRSIVNAVTVRAVVGYGASAASVPDDIKKAIYWMVSHAYAYREPVVSVSNIYEVPMSTQYVINRYKSPIVEIH